MKEHKAADRVVPFPRFQRQMIDWLELTQRKHVAHVLVEVDVTSTRQEIREYRMRTGLPLSVTAFITACFAQAIEENPLMHAYRKGRGKLVLLGDVDVTVAIEREVEDQRIPVPLIIRAANRKSLEEIDREIRTGRTGENPQARAMRWLPLWLVLPALLRRLVWRSLLSSPYRRKRIMGTTMVSNAGMFGSGVGWGVSPSIYTVSLLIGSLARRPNMTHVNGKVREYLCLTICVDHDIIDGAVAARFIQRLKELIEKVGPGLDSQRPHPIRNGDAPARLSLLDYAGG